MANNLSSFIEEIPFYTSDIGYDTFIVSIRVDDEELLSKADDYPMQEGQFHPDGARIARMHPSGQLMWHATPDIARKHDQHINNPELRRNFLNQIPSLKHRKAMEQVMIGISKDPNRHFIPTEENGRHKLRARHIKSLLLGTDDIKIDTSHPNQLAIHRKSHSRGQNIGSTVPHLFNIKEVPNVQKTEKYDETGIDGDFGDFYFRRHFRDTRGDRRSTETSGAGLQSAGGFAGNDYNSGRLEKGLHGDWTKEGYTLSHEHYNDSGTDEIGTHIRIVARDKMGNIVGNARFQTSPNMLYPVGTAIHPDHTRKGLATAMYGAAENITGKKITPSTARTDESKALWSQSNRSFGKSEMKWRLERDGHFDTWQDSYLKHKTLEIAPPSSTHWHPLVRLQYDLLNQGKLMYHPKHGYMHNRKFIDRGDGSLLMKSEDHGYCTMFMFDGIDKPDILHVTHKYFGKEFKDEKDIIKVLKEFFDKNPFKPFTEIFDEEEFFGENNDIKVLRPKSNRNFLLDLKEKLEEIVKDKWPEYKPHTSVSANVDKIDYPIVDYVLTKGGRVIWSATNTLYKNEIEFLLSKQEQGNLKLVHFGRVPGLKTLDPQAQGTGYPNVAMKRRGKPEHPVTYFYREGQYTEPGVVNSARSKYHVTLQPEHKLYDIGHDHEKVVDSALKENNGAWNPDLIEGKIKAAGYHGYYNSKGALPSAVAVFYSTQPHLEEVLRV